MNIFERSQNVTIGSTVKLRLFAYNSNLRADFYKVYKVDIYFLDPDSRHNEDHHGHVLIATINSDAIIHENTGEYSILLPIDSSFVIGKYVDVWHVEAIEGEPVQHIQNQFDVISNLWFTTPFPIVYDFNFTFRPNKIKAGSIKYIEIEVEANVPHARDLDRVYEALAIIPSMTLTMTQICGDCISECDSDLNIVLDNVAIPLKDKNHAYYLMDTTNLDCGIYSLVFTLPFGELVFVSDAAQLQIYP